MPTANALSHAPRGTLSGELAVRIRHDISHGILPVGTRLPAVPQLAKANGVGINTVRRAVSLLVDEGLLDRRQGSGTYVIATSADRRACRAIGVLTPSLTYYYPQVISGVEQAASHRNVDVVIACSYYDIDREFTELRRLVDAGVDGLLLVPNLHRASDPHAHLDRLRAAPIPYLLVERSTEAMPLDRTPYVCTDTFAGAYAAIAHLAGLGRRRIGHIGHLSSAPGASVFRGYGQAMNHFGLEIIDAAILRRPSLTMSDVAMYVATCAAHRLDAVFCLGDPFAATLVRELGKSGIAVPDDVAVVTFDDEFAHMAEVPLTAVAPPKFELGRLAADLLIRQLELGQTAVPCQVRLPPELVIRASCGATPTTALDLVFEATG